MPGDVGPPALDESHPPRWKTTDLRTVASVGLFVLAILYTLHLGRSLIMPIVLAILLDLLLKPVVRTMKRARIPEPLGAGLVLLAFIALLAVITYEVADPAKDWISKAPKGKHQIEMKLRELRKQAEEVTQAVEEVRDVAGDEKAVETQQVEIKSPSLGRQLLGGTTGFLSALTVVLFLTYFLLSAGDLFLEKLIKVLPHFGDKKLAVSIARKTEAQVSTYLFTITLINAGVGIATWAALYFLKMPNPTLWAVVAALLNFIPYLGAFATMAILAVAASLSFDELHRALAIPGAFALINIIEGYLITPAVLGRRLSLNSPVVFVSVVFWWYLWGIPGALLAVPMVATAKIFCDHIGPLAPLGEFLGRQDGVGRTNGGSGPADTCGPPAAPVRSGAP